MWSCTLSESPGVLLLTTRGLYPHGLTSWRHLSQWDCRAWGLRAEFGIGPLSLSSCQWQTRGVSLTASQQPSWSPELNVWMDTEERLQPMGEQLIFYRWRGFCFNVNDIMGRMTVTLQICGLVYLPTQQARDHTVMISGCFKEPSWTTTR